MMIKKILIALFVIICIFAVGYNAYRSEQHADNGKKKVYAILPLTGTMASVGKEVKKTVEVYTQNHPNMPMEVQFYDNQSDPNQTINIAKQISFSDTQPLFMCGVSGLCRPLLPVLPSINGFLILSPSPRAETEDFQNFQRISFSHLDMNLPFIEYVKPGQKVIIIHSNDETGHSGSRLISDNLQAKGIDIIEKIAFEHKELDNRLIVMKAMSYNPDVIIVTAGPSMGFVKIIKTLKEQEYPGMIFADPSLRTPSLISLFSEDESQGIYVPVMSTDRIYKEYPQVAQALTENGLELYNFPINVWDTLNILNYFVANNIPFNQSEFIKMGKWHGISGDIVFTENGNSSYPFILSVIKDGKFVPADDGGEK